MADTNLLISIRSSYCLLYTSTGTEALNSNSADICAFHALTGSGNVQRQIGIQAAVGNRK